MTSWEGTNVDELKKVRFCTRRDMVQEDGQGEWRTIFTKGQMYFGVTDGMTFYSSRANHPGAYSIHIRHVKDSIQLALGGDGE